jgi:putative hydrolase of the HAD superfamily
MSGEHAAWSVPGESIEAVCFDLDDTLYDYHEYARAGLRAAADRLERLTGQSVHEELQRLYFEQGRTQGTFDALLDRHEIQVQEDADALVEDLVDAYHAAADPLDPYPETERVLSRLGREYELGLITDGRNGRAKLRRLGIEDHFEVVVVGPELDRSKRDPVVFQRAISGLDGEPERTVYVGDDPRVDFRVPNRLGMATIRLRRGRYADLEPDGTGGAPDAEIDHLDAVPALVT